MQGCYILVQGNTVSVMGSFKGIKQGTYEPRGSGGIASLTPCADVA